MDRNDYTNPNPQKVTSGPEVTTNTVNVMSLVFCLLLGDLLTNIVHIQALYRINNLI